jgi:hypothetical protein
LLDLGEKEQSLFLKFPLILLKLVSFHGHNILAGF